MPLDPEDLEAIAKLISSAVGDSEKSLREDMKRRAAAQEKERLEAQKKAEDAKKERLEAKSQEKSHGEGDALDRAAILEKKLAEMAARAEQSERDRAAAEEQRKQSDLRNQVRAAVSDKFPTIHIDNVMARLAADQRYAYDDNGQPGLKFDRNGYSEILPIAEGIAEFAESDIGKAFSPPSNAQGTGDGIKRPSTTPRTPEGKADWGSLRDSISGSSSRISGE